MVTKQHGQKGVAVSGLWDCALQPQSAIVSQSVTDRDTQDPQQIYLCLPSA